PPRGAQLPRKALHGSVFAAQLADRPPTRPAGEQGPRPGEVLVLLGEPPSRTGRFDAAPGPLAPHQLHRPTNARDVDQPHLTPAMAVRDHPADPTALDPRRRLDHDPQPWSVPAVLLGDLDNMEPVEPDQQVTPRAVT